MRVFEETVGIGQQTHFAGRDRTLSRSLLLMETEGVSMGKEMFECNGVHVAEEGVEC